jgi:23S rRNA U2552 (ribose-2'-O)-methylase RlmE/FtsJ
MEEFQTKPPWATFEILKTKHGVAPLDFSYSEWKDDTPDKLKNAKKNIEPLEKSHVWELAKKMANPYELIYTVDDKYFHPSLSSIKPLSRSYFKLIEILELTRFFEGIPRHIQNVTSSHIAEGPGGFIQAFLESAEKAKKRVARAYSMTLNPTNQNIPGWKRATTFLQKHPCIRLTYGEDNTGDIYKKENQTFFANITNHTSYLYTADGGFDFSINYEKQENTIFLLLVSSFLIGLKSLRKDGMMIVKLFDVFSEHSQVLVVLMGRQFQKWTLYKPLTSRACNSERYFIGQGFHGYKNTIYEKLEEIEGKAKEGQYPLANLEEYERLYLNQHIEKQMAKQLRAIENAICFSKNPDEWYNNHFEKSFAISKDWCHRFHIPSTIHTPRSFCRFQSDL